MFGLGSFESNVLIGACVTLIILLAIIGYLLSLSKLSVSTWPPTIAVCPDYWEDPTGTGKECTNVHNLGKCSGGPYDLTTLVVEKNRCQASKDVKYCDLSWDGITNDDNACAASSDKQASSSSMPRFMTIAIVIIVIIAFMYLMSSSG